MKDLEEVAELQKYSDCKYVPWRKSGSFVKL